MRKDFVSGSEGGIARSIMREWVIRGTSSHTCWEVRNAVPPITARGTPLIIFSKMLYLHNPSSSHSPLTTFVLFHLPLQRPVPVDTRHRQGTYQRG